MSNGVFKLSLSSLFGLRGKAVSRARVSEKDKITSLQEETALKIYMAGTWKAHSGMSSSGWGQPW